MEAVFEELEVLMTPKYQKVRLLGVVGVTGSNMVATLVYEQPKDAEFDFVAVTVPKETARKIKNRRHRQNGHARRVICGGTDGNGVGTNRRTRHGKRL